MGGFLNSISVNINTVLKAIGCIHMPNIFLANDTHNLITAF